MSINFRSPFRFIQINVGGDHSANVKSSRALISKLQCVGCSFSTFAELGPTVEPLVNAALPKPLKNFQFVKTHLGKDHVSVDRVTVHKRYKDAVALDLDVNFSGKPDISMKVSPLGSTFGVEEIRWFGRLSVLMRPLTTTLPCIGAVQASFITHPTLEIDFTGAASFADIGPVERIIRKVVRDVLASMLVLPNHFLYKLNDSIDFFDVVSTLEALFEASALTSFLLLALSVVSC